MYLNAEVKAKLLRRVPGLVIDRATGPLPTALIGSLHGMPFYLNYYGGRADLLVGGDLDVAPLYSASYCGPQDWAELYESAFADYMLLLVPRLRRAPRLWSFEGTVNWLVEGMGLKDLKAGDRVVRQGWGMTAKDAYVFLTTPREDLAIHYGYSIPHQRVDLAAIRLDPESVTNDERVWPDPEPEFRVLPADGSL